MGGILFTERNLALALSKVQNRCLGSVRGFEDNAWGKKTLLLCQGWYYQHSSELTMQKKFLNKNIFIIQSFSFERKCTQEWAWNQKHDWCLLGCEPQLLLPKHPNWMGLVPCALDCWPDSIIQGSSHGPTVPVLSGQGWPTLLSSWGSGRDRLKTYFHGLHFRGVLGRRMVLIFLIAVQPHLLFHLPGLLQSSWI